MFLATVFLDLGVDILHQGVPLHQHVSEGRAREDPDNLSKVTKLSVCQSFWKSQISNLFSSSERNIGYRRIVFSSQTFVANKFWLSIYFTFELRGGKRSRFPAKMRSTVASSRVMVLFVIVCCCFNDHWTVRGCGRGILISFIDLCDFLGNGAVAGYFRILLSGSVTSSQRRLVPYFIDWLPCTGAE